MDERIIVTLPSSGLRALGRESLAGKWQKVALATAILIITLTLPQIILETLLFSENSAAVSIYTLLVTGPFSFGFSLLILNIFRNQKMEFTQLFAGFEKFGKTFILFLLISIFTTLWTMLFIIPGIIATFRYSQAYFIMVDHPEYSPMQCIAESKRIMTGNKAKLFCLQFSFIGWILLCMVPTVIVSAIISVPFNPLTAGAPEPSVGITAFFIQILTMISMAGICWVVPYMECASAAMYEMLVGNLKANSDNIAHVENVLNTMQEAPTPYVQKEEPQAETIQTTPVEEQPQAEDKTE